MSRDYGRILVKFWNSPDIRPLSNAGKLLASYLLTCQHSNCIGAYLLPDAYIGDDLGWSGAEVTKALAELASRNFAVRFRDGRHICIVKYLEFNAIENPNVGKAALKALEQLPDDPAIRHVLKGLLAYQKQFPNGLETVSERFRNMEPEPDMEPEPEPEMDLARSANADVKAAYEIYNFVAHGVGWPEAQRLTDKRRNQLRARLAECGGLEGWRAAMDKARASPFLRGDKGRDKGHEGWAPDLDFFLQESSFTKLMEGKYDERANNSETPQCSPATLAAIEIINGSRAA